MTYFAEYFQQWYQRSVDWFLKFRWIQRASFSSGVIGHYQSNHSWYRYRPSDSRTARVIGLQGSVLRPTRRVRARITKSKSRPVLERSLWRLGRSGGREMTEEKMKKVCEERGWDLRTTSFRRLAVRGRKYEQGCRRRYCGFRSGNV
jgi:hypothetical protein